GRIGVMAQSNAQQLTITISDNGHGIPEELQARIFEPFFTTKTATKNSGMGLGLSICKSLVEAMNGTIKITSQSGTGTTCEITLPVSNER
ncbi:MAG: ATP-binding protein, partial [candidate division KSB1 bacterium]